ncbi:MAG: N-acetylmuramoyl-L-alanine amidase [Patescibacteria group bacterium]|nr:N-acetylmuramoyl-L-alanine amidase [Patescibacteria group bacterium]
MKFSIFGTVAVLAIVFLGTRVASASPAFRSSEVIDNPSPVGAYTSPILTMDFPCTVVGFGWQGAGSLDMSIRLYSGHAWGGWFGAKPEDSLERDGWNMATDPIIAASATKLQYQLGGSDDITAIKFVCIGTEHGSIAVGGNFFRSVFKSAAAAEGLDVVSRSEWEADEDWRFDSDGEEVWAPEYEWPTTFVVHHTAGGTGGSNPAATIRGVYYWHAVSLGWGDIGYNYLIDQNGTIYEGRYGGDGVIGAHTFRDAACNSARFGGNGTVNFNEGSIGIAVLGDYETKQTLNAKVKAAIATLTAHKGKTFGIRPEDQNVFHGDTYPNIVGHKDLDCTICPGKNLYSKLAGIRTAAQEKYDALPKSPQAVVKATFVGQSEQPLTMPAGTTKEMWVEFRNDGTETWRNYSPAAPTVIAQSSGTLKLTGSGSNAPTLVTANVAPGETGRFAFSITAPRDALDVTEEFALAINGKVLSGTTFTVTATVTDLEYAAAMDSMVIKPATFINATQLVTVKIKNRGTKTWQHGSYKLRIYDLGDAVSRFRDTSWPGEYGDINFSEASVKPGKLATFTFTFRSPDEPGLFYNRYRLHGDEAVVQKEDRSITRVDSPWQAAFVEHNIPAAVMNVWRLGVVIKFKNTGITTWDRSVVLKAYDLGDAVSRFHDISWVNNYSPARLKEQSVKPGETGTFEFRFRSPAEPGVYFDRFVLDRNGSAVQGGEFTLLTRVDK